MDHYLKRSVNGVEFQAGIIQRELRVVHGELGDGIRVARDTLTLRVKLVELVDHSAGEVIHLYEEIAHDFISAGQQSGQFTGSWLDWRIGFHDVDVGDGQSPVAVENDTYLSGNPAEYEEITAAGDDHVSAGLLPDVDIYQLRQFLQCVKS